MVAAAALLFVPLPIPPTYAGRTIENAGHMPLFFIGTLFILSILRHELGVRGCAPVRVRRAHRRWAPGAVSELMQKPLRRDASWDDVFADAVGVVCALAVHAAVSRREKLSGAARAAAALIALGCIAVYVAPIVSMVRAYVHRNAQFPVLASFDSRVELAWIVGYGIRRDVIADVLEVEFVPHGVSGIFLLRAGARLATSTRPW